MLSRNPLSCSIGIFPILIDSPDIVFTKINNRKPYNEKDCVVGIVLFGKKG